MNNNLFSQFGRNNSGNDSGFLAMIQRFNEFRRNFTGDPRQQVERMLQSGQMTQQQFNQLRGMANQIMGMLPK